MVSFGSRLKRLAFSIDFPLSQMELEKRNKSTDKPVTIRIGIHVGSVLSGVIGRRYIPCTTLVFLVQWTLMIVLP